VSLDKYERSPYMGVEEERVGSPRERPGSPVHVVECGGLGKLSAVLVFDVFDVSGVLSLSIVDPGSADSD
jgi:hypothetical protein